MYDDSYVWTMLEVLDVGPMFRDFVVESGVADEGELEYDYHAFFRQFTRKRYPRLTKLLLHTTDEDSQLVYTFMQLLLLSVGEVAANNSVGYEEYIFPHLESLSLEYGEIGSSFDETLLEWKRLGSGRRNSMTVAQNNMLLPVLFPRLRQFYCYHWLPSVQLMYLILPRPRCQSLDNSYHPGIDLVLMGNSNNQALCDFLRNHHDKGGWHVRSMVFLCRSDRVPGHPSPASHYGHPTPNHSPGYAVMQIPESIDCAGVLNSSVLGGVELHSEGEGEGEVDDEDFPYDRMERCQLVMDSVHVAMRSSCRGLGLMARVEHLQLLEEFLGNQDPRGASGYVLDDMLLHQRIRRVKINIAGAGGGGLVLGLEPMEWLECLYEDALDAAVSLSCCPTLQSLTLHTHGGIPLDETIDRIGLFLGCIRQLACVPHADAVATEVASDPLFCSLKSVDIHFGSDSSMPVRDMVDWIAHTLASRMNMVQLAKDTETQLSSRCNAVIRVCILRKGVCTEYHTLFKDSR